MEIKKHKTWDIYDASKIQTYMNCPRRYFFRYILGWTPDVEKSHHLVFGKAWHSAMEYILLNRDKEDEVHLLEGAFNVFLKEYREVFVEETDDTREPKTPEKAFKALAKYISIYGRDKFEILHTEVAGTVPIDERMVHFRIDAIIRDEGKIWALEHKTASRMSQTWVDQWSLKVQIGLYTHVLYCIYDPDDVAGVKINGVFLYKSKDPEMIRVPIRKSKPAMYNWLIMVRDWVSSIVRDESLLLKGEYSTRQPLEIFRQNTESCMQYGGCPFLDFCMAWDNPIKHASEPPAGFKIEWWDPRDGDEDAKNIMSIEDKQMSFDFGDDDD